MFAIQTMPAQSTICGIGLLNYALLLNPKRESLMNRFILIICMVCGMTLASCSGAYSASECERLSDKIVCDEKLSQEDYEDMLVQYEAILKYLISKADKIIEETDKNERSKLRQSIRNDSEYLKRFSYMFTFGSALYQAEVKNELDAKNLNAYKKLDSYVEEFNRRSEDI